MFNSALKTKVSYSNASDFMSMDVHIEIISKIRFAAKAEFSTGFYTIVKKFEKTFWNADEKYWTLPLAYHDQFVTLLQEKNFVVKKGIFYKSKKEFKNSVILKLDSSCKENIEDFYLSNTVVKSYIYLQYFTGHFSNLFKDLSELNPSFNFDQINKCFSLTLPLNFLVDFLKSKFFDITFEYIDEITNAQTLDFGNIEDVVIEKTFKKKKLF